MGSTYGDLQASRAHLDGDEEIDVEEGGRTTDYRRESSVVPLVSLSSLRLKI